MSKAIKVENLSKAYQLGQFGTNTISGDVQRWWMTKVMGKEDPFLIIGEKNERGIKSESNITWSLKNINFEVQQGEALGVIGQNGAGKSTLLKILSRVTSPTKGGFKIKGRVASLLEVGTGFHPELTGKENIFLNGAILGMRKNEIKRRLDEIVDFAGIERYLETPVKRYSSGMYVRLAFAVAAHLDAEILIVDEVLAVGDAEFQKKCIGKMGDISKGEGRAILFVSHNMQSVSALTSKSILLEKGQTLLYAETDKVVKGYLSQKYANDLSYRNYHPNIENPHIESVEIKTSYPNNIHKVGDSFEIEFLINCPISVRDAAISFVIYNSDNLPVIHILNLNSENSFCQKQGRYVLKSYIPTLRLYPDKYYITVNFADNFTKEKYEVIEFICPFEVKVFGQVRDYYWYRKHAIYIEENTWEVWKM